MTKIKSSDLNEIIKILLWVKWENRDKYFFADLFFKSWFDRSTIKFLLNFSNTEEEFISDLLKKYLDNSLFLNLLSNLSDYLLSENENDSLKLKDIVSKYIFSEDSDVSNTKIESKKEDKSLIITWYLNSAVTWIYASWIKIKKYDGLVLEWFKIINNRLKNYCIKIWKWEKVENDAINTIFELEDKNPFKIDLSTSSWENQKIWLKALFNWLVNFYRNPVSHTESYIKTEQEFIEAMFLISMLLNKLDKSEIE